MTDRDHFAAAALTGLLSNKENHWPTAIQWEYLLKHAYAWADAMLAARGRDAHPGPATAERLGTAEVADVGGAGPGVTLTGDERGALRWLIAYLVDGGHANHPAVSGVIATVRGLLARSWKEVGR